LRSTAGGGERNLLCLNWRLSRRPSSVALPSMIALLVNPIYPLGVCHASKAVSHGPNLRAPLRVVCGGSGVPSLKLPLHALGGFSRRRAPPRRVAPMQQHGTVVSPAEYWTFLCAAALLAVAFAMPRTSDGRGKLAKRPNTDAFGTRTRSRDDPRVIQHKRAHEPGRGRGADAPWQIPWRGWKDILWRTYHQIGEHRLLAVAAGVVFYGLLALFPALTAIVSLYGLFANASTITDHLSMAAGILPGGAIDVIREQVARLASKGDAKLGLGFILGLSIALWSANAGMKAIIDALNVVYEEKENRGFIKLNLNSLAFTLAAIVALLLALGAVVVLPLLLAWLWLRDRDGVSGSICALASPGCARHYRSGVNLPLWPEPTQSALAMAEHRKRDRGDCVAWQLWLAVVVSRELRPLRCDLWLAWCCDRNDDVDVDLLDRDPIWRTAQLGDRASNRA
jgi:hypothetical protein